MENNEIDITQLVIRLNDMIYTNSQFTLDNALVYAPIKNKIQLVAFNNKIVIESESNNKRIIKNPENICDSIYFIDNAQFINIVYIPQDNGDVIKYSVNYNKVTGITEYKICNVQQKEKQQFFTTELNNICIIKQLIDENEQNKASSIFEDMLNNSILQSTTDIQLNFNIQSNGKIDNTKYLTLKK